MSIQNINDFQDQVSQLLLRHRSLLDVLSKLSQSNAGVHRSVSKSITECGCIKLHAQKQEFTSDMSIEEAKQTLDTHVEGTLCESCMEAVSAELGKNLFYLSSLCNVLDLKLDTIMQEESKRCATLGMFKLS